MAYLFNKAVQEGKPLGQALNESHTLMHDVYGHNTDWNQIFLYMLYGSPSTRVAGRSAGLTNLMPMKGIGWLAPLLVTNTPQTPGTQITMPIHLNTGAFYVHTRCARNEPAQTPEFSSVIKFNGETIASEVFSQGSDRYLENYNYEASAPEGGRHTLEFMSKILEIPLAVGGTYCVVIVNESDTVYGYSLKVEESQAIEGTILDQNGYPMSGVSLAGFPDDITTGSNEDYRALVHKGWSGIVTPLLIDCLFTPQSRTYTNVTTDFVNEDYTGNLQCGNVTFTPDGGAYTSSQSVTMTCSTSNVQIHYTTNGLDPTQNDPSVLSGGTVNVTVNPATTLKAQAFRNNYTPSEVKTAYYQAPMLYVSTNGNDANSGISWALAKQSVQAAINTAPNDGNIWQVWVQSGTYNEIIALKNNVALYGGFTGTESALAERPPFPRPHNDSNETILTSASSNAIVTSTTGVTGTARLDGFTISGNTIGRAITIDNSNSVIANNTINDSASTGYGGGIMLNGSSSVVTSNIIRDNTASRGGGIACVSSKVVLVNNMIFDNQSSSGGGGVYLEGGSPVLTNNTLVSNYDTNGGGGLRILNSSASVSNNILSWSPGGGIRNSGGSPTLRNNCVFRNKGYDYDGVPPGTGDISVDPMFADLSINDLHILVESPCVNAEWNQAPGLTQYDIDGDLRVFAGMVDIGADECVGLSNRVIHISPLGNDADNGFSWTTAKQTIQGGIYAAIQGDEVWVAAGEYLGQITLEHYVKVYGGFAGTETSLKHRPAFPRLPEGPANSLLDGLLSGSVVTAVGGQNEFCRLDGFAITNGGGVQNGGGIYIQNSSPTITNNVIVGNTASNGAGIYTVLSASLIEGNLFCQNTASGNGGAVFTQGTSIRLANNVMLENSASAGGGIFANQSSARIINNTIVENQAHGILIQGGSPHVVNTIVAFNNQGIAETGSSAVLRNSNLFGNTDGDYMGFVFLQNCISGNPQFTDWEKRIPAQSPCVNAGTLYTSWIPQTDRDGNPRLLHGMVDIGAYEVQFSGTPVSIKDAKLLPDGASVEIDGAIVSATWDDFFYISADDRSSGIRVDRIGHGLLSGMRADITGTITTIAPDGERYLAAVQAVRNGTGVVEPLGIRNKSLGGGSFAFNPLTGAGQCGVHEGTGLNNIGLLVRVWGKVLGMDSSPTPQWMYIDDGSGKVIEAIVEDGTMVLEQKWVDSYVAITGISSCWHDGNKIHPVIRLKTVQVFAMN